MIGRAADDPILCGEDVDDDVLDVLGLLELRRRAADGELRGTLRPGVDECGYERETPVEGPSAVARWVALLDRAEELQREADPEHPCAQRQVRRAIDSLFLYEHQLTPKTRRRAREYVWHRDRADDPLPAISAHGPQDRPALCRCPRCRSEWERCRCPTCRAARCARRAEAAAQLRPLPLHQPRQPGQPHTPTSLPAAVQTQLFAPVQQAS